MFRRTSSAMRPSSRINKISNAKIKKKAKVLKEVLRN